MSRRHLSTLAVTMALPGLAVTVALLAAAPPASAAQAQIGLGTATPYAVLAGSTVTNTGASTISGDVGVAPGTAVTGFPPGLVSNGTIHAADAVTLQAQNDLTAAFNDAAGRTPRIDRTGVDLGGQTLLPGVYNASSSMGLTGTVTLDAQGDPAAVFVFQAGSTLTTASNSTVALIGAANPCNVFWQVGSSATLGTGTTFVGSVLALTSITAANGASVQGRLLARNGQVSLDTNDIRRPACATLPAGTPSTAPTATAAPSAPTATATAGGGKPTPRVTLTAQPSSGPGGSGSGSGGSGSGGSGSSTSGGSTSGGSGSGTPAGPVVPTGHPETGRATAPGPGPGRELWLGGALACLVATGGVALLGSRRRVPAHRG